MSTIRILLADDHNVLRQGIAQVLSAQPDMTVVAQAATGDAAVAAAQAHQPDVVLMDISMPGMDGVEATRHIMALPHPPGVIILTMYRRDDFVFEAIKAGARGYLLKEVELEELLAAIRTVARGDAVVDPAIAGRLLAALRGPGEEDDSALSERDIAILRLVGEGMSNQAIASELALAEKTVRNRLSALFQRLQLQNRTQAALYAVRKGLVDPHDLTDSA